MDPRTYYDRMADGYERERHAGYHAFLDDAEADCVADLVRGRDVLEVGCGTGLVMNRLARRAARVAGVDLSPGMLARAAGRGHAVACGDATRLPFADRAFDAAVCFKVLPHVPDPRAALREMARVVRPGGHVAVEVYNRASLRAAIKRLKPASPIAAGVDDTDVFTRYDTLDDVRGWLAPDLDLVAVHGIRVLLPAAVLARLPLAGPVLLGLERRLSRTPLARFAGFLVVVARRR